MKKLERICEIMAFILRLMGGSAYSKTKLVKLLYLLDVMYARKGKMNFTGIEYTSYYYGPYSEEIDKSLQLLEQLGYITPFQQMGSEGKMYSCLDLHGDPEFGQLTGQEKSEIRQLLSRLVNRSLEELLDITYATKEYKRTNFSEVIRL